MRGVSLQLCVLLTVWAEAVFFTNAVAQSQRDADNDFVTVLEAQVTVLMTQGYELNVKTLVEPKPEGQPTSVELNLSTGVEYAFIATCAAPCGATGIEVARADGTSVAGVREDGRLAALSGQMPAADTYVLKLTPIKCVAVSCQMAIAILAKPSTIEPSTAPPTNPQIAQKPAEPSPPDPATVLIETVIRELASIIMMPDQAAAILAEGPAPKLTNPIRVAPEDAPGKPTGYQPNEPRIATPSAPVRKSRAAQPSSANCQRVAQEYHASIESAGEVASMQRVTGLYRYLQCSCGYPRSPHIPNC